MGKKMAKRRIKVDGDVAIVALTLGKVAVIDAADVDLVSQWCWHTRPDPDGRCYARRGDGVRLHRLIMQPDDDMVVDHINGDGLDNRRCNLRVATVAQNNINKSAASGKSMRGTYMDRHGRWRACISRKNKTVHLGSHATEQEAHDAYLAAARDEYGEWLPSHLQK